MFPRLAADTILIGPHHASAELVENAEGRLIARQAKLSLKLNRRDAGRLAGDQISRPKPCAQRHMAAFHDGANRQARIVAALATAQDTGTSGDAEGIACGMAMRTDEAVAPSSFFHVGSTLRFIGKNLLKLWKRPRKGQVVTLKTSMAHYPLYTQNLSLVGVCVKRIGKLLSLLFVHKYGLNPLHFFGTISLLLIFPSLLILVYLIGKHTLYWMGFGAEFHAAQPAPGFTVPQHVALGDNHLFHRVRLRFRFAPSRSQKHRGYSRFVRRRGR